MNEKDLPKQRGQSIILVAVAMVALVIFVALTVDLSNAYYHRRMAQNAADASVLAGAAVLGGQMDGGSYSDRSIKIEMNDYAERNYIEDTNGVPGDEVNDNLVGYYLDKREIRIGEVGAGSVPVRTVGLEAIAYITAPTFFGGILGFDGYAVQADAAVIYDLACTGENCMLPIAIKDTGFLDNYFSNTNQCFNMWDGGGEGNFGWLNWSLQSPPPGQGEYTYSCQDEILRELGWEGNLPDDCSAQCLDINLNPEYCNRIDPMTIKVGDYVGGEPGVMNAAYIHDWLDKYILEEILAKIVVYDDRRGKGGCGKLDNRNGFEYRVAGFACFEITGYRLSTGTGQEVRCDETNSDLDGDGLPDLNCGSTWAPDLRAHPRECLDYPTVCQMPNGDPCDWETGDFNRITGYLVPCTGGNAGRCTAIGNLITPMLTR